MLNTFTLSELGIIRSFKASKLVPSNFLNAMTKSPPITYLDGDELQKTSTFQVKKILFKIRLIGIES